MEKSISISQYQYYCRLLHLCIVVAGIRGHCVSLFPAFPGGHLPKYQQWANYWVNQMVEMKPILLNNGRTKVSAIQDNVTPLYLVLITI